MTEPSDKLSDIVQAESKKGNSLNSPAGYMLVGAGIGLVSTCIASCGYCIYDGCANREMSSLHSVIYAHMVTFLINRPAGIIGIIGGGSLGRVAYAVKRRIAHHRAESRAGRQQT